MIMWIIIAAILLGTCWWAFTKDKSEQESKDNRYIRFDYNDGTTKTTMVMNVEKYTGKPGHTFKWGTVHFCIIDSYAVEDGIVDVAKEIVNAN